MSTGDIFNESDAAWTPIQTSPEWESKLKAGSGFAILFVSLLGNFLIAFTLLKRNQLVTAGHRFLFSLSASNFVLTILVVPFIIFSSLKDSWIFGVFWCKFTGFVTLLVAIASMLTMGVIAIDRYSAIVKPMVYPTSLANTKSIGLIIYIWIQAVTFSVPPLFGWSSFEYQPHSNSCQPTWDSNIFYAVSVLITCALLPFIVMISCYYTIFQVARQKCRKIHVGMVANTVETSQISKNSRKPSWTITYHSSNKALCIISVVLGTFIIIWFPYLIGVAVELGMGPKILPSWYETGSSWLSLSGTAIYPLVYGLLNRTIRKEMWALLCPRRVSIQKTNSKTHRLSISGHIMDFSPTKFFFSRPSWSNTIDYNIVGRRRSSSQDSGAVLTNNDESDLDTEATIFASYTSFRRMSAPSCMQNIELHQDTVGANRFKRLFGSISSQGSEQTFDTEGHLEQSNTTLEHQRKLSSFFSQRPSLSSISSNKENLSEPVSCALIHLSPRHSKFMGVEFPAINSSIENLSNPPLPLINNLLSENEKEPPPRQNRLVSVDEGIVKDCMLDDCVLEDLES